MPTSVLRRYTPPTCTLEIAATGSALSRWTDRAVLKNLRFQLSLDDPKLPEDKQVLLRGDRTQLEALWGAVMTYVQSQLGQPPELYSAPSSLPSATGNGTVIPFQSLASANPVSDSSASDRLESDSLESNSLEGESVGDNRVGDSLAAKTGIRLQSRGLVSHDLHLGTLATEQSGAIVPLSALQLFDLANVLDEYHAEALTLPALGRPAWTKSPSHWGGIAAAMLLAIGATTALTKFVTDVSHPQIASAPTSESPATFDAEQGKSSTRLPSPPGLEPLPSALTLQPLPPPPPAGATKSTAPAPSGTVTIPQGATAPPATAPLTENSGQVAVLPQPAIAPGNPTVLSAPSAANGAAVNPAALGASEAPGAGNDPGVDNPDRVALSRSAQSQTLRPDPSAASSATSSPTSGTAFDAIPQVAEVRNYFQQKWQPPQELSQTLEYSLVLNANGSIQRIVPLGVAAETFIDRTDMPLMNEPFVSPIANGGNPQIRLVLGQDGKVQTFLERK